MRAWGAWEHGSVWGAWECMGCIKDRKVHESARGLQMRCKGCGGAELYRKVGQLSGVHGVHEEHKVYATARD